MGMETDVLRWFQQVADGVTVTEVADLYMISQPAVSRALARLEEEVGTPLLLKSGRVLRPTHAGSVFKGHVDSLMHQLDDGLAAVSELATPETGTVTVAFQQSLGTWLVPNLIGRFRSQYPQVQFRLEQSHDHLGSSLVAGGRVDLEFTARRPRNPEVHWQRLLAQPLGLAVPSDHRYASRTSLSLAEVADENFLMLRPGWEFRTLCDQLCAAAGFTPRVAFEADDLSVVLGFVDAGLGVGVVPTTAIERGPSSVTGHRIVRLTDEGAYRNVGIAWSQTRRLLPSAELFRVAVLQFLKRPADAAG
jgi:LysR family transcriptional activator of glutamate synthase operon